MRQGVHPSDWSSLAEQLLVHVFEQQHNALDNCAAACTCATWRRVVNSSHISLLHLHADQAPYGNHWRHFFASRCSFGHLRLTAGDKSVEGKVVDNFGDPSSRSNSLQGIPLACDCLSVDTTFAGMLPKYIQQPASLKQLAVTWDCNWVNWTNFETFAFPNLNHLAELTTLQIRAEKGSGSPPAELVQYNMNRCPETLKHVTLDRLSLQHRDGQRSAIQQGLGSAAASLTCLELSRCDFGFGGSSISCLAHLKSLSFQGSTVWSDPSDITMLTNLSLLDLSESEWHWPKRYHSRVPVMLLFTGWSALQVLKLSKCSLFGSESVLRLPNVVNLQLHWAPVSIGSSTLRICSHLASQQWMFDLLPHANWLAELDILLEPLASYNDYAQSHVFAERIVGLLSLCHRLQSFTFTGAMLTGFLDAEKLVVDRDSAACLHRLSLSKVCFQLLDLHTAVHVTSLELHNVDAVAGFTLMLPPRVQSFEFTGTYLFTLQARQALSAYTCLNKLKVVYDNHAGKRLMKFGMPLLPNSLHHLDIQISRGWVDCCDWKCLRACTNIEHLRLPSPKHLVGYLKAWIHGARHLHIVEFSMYCE